MFSLDSCLMLSLCGLQLLWTFLTADVNLTLSQHSVTVLLYMMQYLYCSTGCSTFTWISVDSFSVRHRRTSSTHVQAAAWLPTSWASVIAITTTSCSAPPVTCSTSTLGSSWATPRCLAASRGETQATSIASFQVLWPLVWCHLFMWVFNGHVIHAEDLKDLITSWVKSWFNWGILKLMRVSGSVLNVLRLSQNQRIKFSEHSHFQ